jgi:hypothetical protein
MAFNFKSRINSRYVKTVVPEIAENSLLILDSPMTIPAIPSYLAMASPLFQKAEPGWRDTEVKCLIDAAFASLG